jgi:hypothetical protein
MSRGDAGLIAFWTSWDLVDGDCAEDGVERAKRAQDVLRVGPLELDVLTRRRMRIYGRLK